MLTRANITRYLPKKQREAAPPSGEVTDLLLQLDEHEQAASGGVGGGGRPKKERILFALHTGDDPGVDLGAMPDDAAFVKLDSLHTKEDENLLRKAVELGFMVRTRVHRPEDEVTTDGGEMLRASAKSLCTIFILHINPFYLPFLACRSI